MAAPEKVSIFCFAASYGVALALEQPQEERRVPSPGIAYSPPDSEHEAHQRLEHEAELVLAAKQPSPGEIADHPMPETDLGHVPPDRTRQVVAVNLSNEPCRDNTGGG